METVKGVVAGGATVVVMVAVMVTVVIAVVVAIVISVVVVVVIWLCWPLPSGPWCPGGCGGESGSDDDSSGGGGGENARTRCCRLLCLCRPTQLTYTYGEEWLWRCR